MLRRLRYLANGSWHRAYGSWWYIALCLDGWLSLGLHVDPRHRERYGPYVDLHLLVLVVSVGRHPIFADADELVMRAALPKERG